MPEDLKKQARKIAEQRNLCSYMNNTKWNELRSAMLNEMPFPPAFIVKTLFENECADEKDFRNDVYYHGDWYEGLNCGEYFNGGFAIEWIKVRPRCLRSRGQLIAPEIVDESEKFEAILNKYNIPYEKQDDVYCIYGYK